MTHIILFICVLVLAVSGVQDGDWKHSSLLQKQGAFANMNGLYEIANPNQDARVQFSTDYSTKNVEYFEVYTLPIQTVYAEVYWTMQDPVLLPQDIITRFRNKTIAIVGYEADQVFKTPNGDVSVPIYWSYNHHYCAWILGANANLVYVPNSGHHNDHGLEGFWQVIGPETDTFIPNNQFISEGNGGEYRKSFHGYPEGYAQLLMSPTKFQIQPMQIDTHNRDYHGPGFKAGLLPKESLAPPGANYSGLLECPCTTRITKTWSMTYGTLFNNTCKTPVANASECFSALNILGLNVVQKQVISDKNLASGCSIIYQSDGNVTAMFNTLENSPKQCGSGNQLFGYTKSVVELSLTLDKSVPEGKVIINMTGPADVWFGVGFNAQIMADRPYVVVIDGNGVASEHKIGDHQPGSVLSPTQVKIVSSSVKNNLRTVILTREFKGVTSDHFTFDPTQSSIPFINAVGMTPEFSYHLTKAPATLVLSVLDTPTCVCNNGLKGWINGLAFEKYCAPEPVADLVAQQNPTCWIQTYQGGLSCCHHKNILLDADQPVDTRTDEIYLKFRFYFQEYKPATPSTPASHMNLHRFYFQTEAFAGEYDVPKCPEGIPPSECIHEITSRWQVKDMLDCTPGKDPHCMTSKNGFALIYAGGHCHAPSCISIELYNADTGELLCRQTPLWGTGSTNRFDEAGYLALPPCLWGSEEEGLVPPSILSLNTNLLSVKRNNNTVGHYGEMASWQMRGVFL